MRLRQVPGTTTLFLCQADGRTRITTLKSQIAARAPANAIGILSHQSSASTDRLVSSAKSQPANSPAAGPITQATIAPGLLVPACAYASQLAIDPAISQLTIWTAAIRCHDPTAL